MEFHISRQARDQYKFSDTLFSFTGNVIFANTRAVLEFADVMNKRINLALFPEKTIQASQVYAMGLIDEIFHYIFQLYRMQVNPTIFQGLMDELTASLPSSDVQQALVAFCDEFPTNDIYRHTISVEEFLSGSSGAQPNHHVALEELLLLWLTNQNPAYMRYAELFDDSNLVKHSAYKKMFEISSAYFKKQPFFGPEKLDLLTMLHKPVEASPHSLAGQLEYIRNNWSFLLGDLLSKLLGSLDFIKEETKTAFGGGPGPAHIPDYHTISQMIDLESERFSPDKDWMPSLVLIAKNSYVWLYQLSKKYNRQLTRLDEIPDEELNFLAYAGITGLWLIGLWQRSKASEHIKRLCGNPEAVASAYSIDSYRIADDLGGEEAFNNLRERAWKRGIRLASDMVPNHFGIDSGWVLNKPDYFLSLDYCPFPSYSFTGENLSPDPAIGIRIEDHYFTRTDASVVFKREDYHTGSVKYIYHGNDGTVMPWNDTAQLNYLLPEVREEIIQIILDVARRTPIIRFDAAMTLAKKHIQRLWFPEPGSGGAIPTRSEHSMSKADFDRLLPVEFWREVVDRVAQEVPDTLLLAEAFWLMEGYFVRTLGMHRVYNSAFMHMLRNEDNANFKTLIKNTLEFDPDILKRYVNFMNNPDEKTAVDQFGSGDKYFGVCTVMSTLPGLPMFGHGQLEGYAEKYGMEYRRAYLDESVNEGLMAHHFQSIFPLLRQRACYSGSLNFRLYDFYTSDGQVNEDILAYSNNHSGYRSLVVFHNKYAEAKGWLNFASPFLIKLDSGNQIVTNKLSDALGCTNQTDHFLIYKELNTSLMYIRESLDVINNGLFFDLHAYDYRVYTDFHEVKEEQGTHYRELCQKLAGQGVADLNAEMQRIHIRSFSDSLHKLVQPEVVKDLNLLFSKFSPGKLRSFMAKNQQAVQQLEWHFHELEPGNHNGNLLLEVLKLVLSDVARFQNKYIYLSFNDTSVSSALSRLTQLELAGKNLPAYWVWLIATALHRTTYTDSSQLSSCFSRWFLTDFFAGHPQNDRLSKTICFLMLDQSDLDVLTLDPAKFLELKLQNLELQNALGVNRAGDTLWFNQESMEEWLKIKTIQCALSVNSLPDWDDNQKLEETVRAYEKLNKIRVKTKISEFKVEKLLELLEKP